jgi:hypothetical protein
MVMYPTQHLKRIDPQTPKRKKMTEAETPQRAISIQMMMTQTHCLKMTELQTTVEPKTMQSIRSMKMMIKYRWRLLRSITMTIAGIGKYSTL